MRGVTGIPQWVSDRNDDFPLGMTRGDMPTTYDVQNVRRFDPLVMPPSEHAFFRCVRSVDPRTPPPGPPGGRRLGQRKQ
jgi:hypothetical protein